MLGDWVDLQQLKHNALDVRSAGLTYCIVRLPQLQVLAVEKSQQAREWAVMNANRLQLSSRVQVPPLPMAAMFRTCYSVSFRVPLAILHSSSLLLCPVVLMD